ncbi:MAG: glycosyl transferase [Lachnospiraceae bacterium]|nr:glycosyl transferase [Lachnospiraceae bacterium]
MIGTELLKGQGLGNQLFCYVTTRCIAKRQGLDFSILGSETMANNIHSNCGLYFMDLDYGVPAVKEDFPYFYAEREDRLFLGTSRHDMQHGAYVTGTDEKLLNAPDGTLLFGNMQAEDYYLDYKADIRQWLKVKPEYDCMEYCKDNLCIIHLRCSDYMDSPELFLRRKYWYNGMKNMKKINPDMEFMIITNDVTEANKYLPGIPAFNFDLAKDYAIIKNARYLLLANSSFTYFPAFTSETLRYVIAPKYWARHNVSDGFWASEQNIYEGFHYMDRAGKVFTAEECRQELEEYKKTSAKYRRLNQKPGKITSFFNSIEATYLFQKYRTERIARGVMRRIRRLTNG